MIKPLRIPQSLTWRAWIDKCLRERDRIQEEAKLGGKPTFKPDLYKGERNAILEEFGYKCAYCETRITAAMFTGDVEHYRPKGRVSDENGRPIRLESGRDHPGYYWLAYEWSNLLPACEACNRPGREPNGRGSGKHDRFPVRGQHASCEEELPLEEPLLINPRLEDPSIHLVFDPETGFVAPVDGSERGRITIKILGLNRDGLVEARRDAIKMARLEFGEVQSEIRKVFDFAALDQLNRYYSGEVPYSAACCAALALETAKLAAFLDQIDKRSHL